MKEILRELREKNNLSQATVAEYLGVSRQMYMKYESGENEPSVKIVVLLSKLYKVSYEHIIDNKIDNKIHGKINSKTYRYRDASYEIASPTPVYGASKKAVGSKTLTEMSASSLDVLYMHKFNSLSSEQKTIVGNLIESLAAMNKSLVTPKKKNYREPGGLTGDFYIADDFDETPECFKEYT